MSALWRIVLMRFWRSLSGIIACNPKPLPLGEGLCMLGGLCIVQSLLAYTPGIRAGHIIGGCRPCDLAWGFAPNPIYFFLQSGTEQKLRSSFIFTLSAKLYLAKLNVYLFSSISSAYRSVYRKLYSIAYIKLAYDILHFGNR